MTFRAALYGRGDFTDFVIFTRSQTTEVLQGRIIGFRVIRLIV